MKKTYNNDYESAIEFLSDNLTRDNEYAILVSPHGELKQDTGCCFILAHTQFNELQFMTPDLVNDWPQGLVTKSESDADHYVNNFRNKNPGAGIKLISNDK